MPAENRRGAAVGTPGFGELAEQLFARARVQPQDAADGLLHRQVAGRPDVGTPLGEEQIDFGRPAPDALHLGEQRDRILRSEEHTSELQSLMRTSYAVFCL